MIGYFQLLMNQFLEKVVKMQAILTVRELDTCYFAE